jgi:hypothetical protein
MAATWSHYCHLCLEKAMGVQGHLVHGPRLQTTCPDHSCPPSQEALALAEPSSEQHPEQCRTAIGHEDQSARSCIQLLHTGPDIRLIFSLEVTLNKERCPQNIMVALGNQSCICHPFTYLNLCRRLRLAVFPASTPHSGEQKPSPRPC